MKFPHLFEPIRLGPRTSRNRVMRVSTATNSGRDGGVTDQMIAVHRRLAAGGTGVIVSESMRVHASMRGRNESLLLHRPETVPHLARVVEAVHAEGALFIAQLNHGGRQHHANEHPTLMAPSAVACPHSGGTPHAMTKHDIGEIVEGFAATARNARDAGCAGIEIHGAQGHLIQEFLSPFSNKRSDEYGGSLANRARFACEIVQAIRERIGPDLVLGYRMGVHEFWPGALDVEQSQEAAALLDALGAIDYFSLAQGNFNTLDYHLPDSHFPPAAFVDIQAEVKRALPRTPVAASARITTPEQAEKIIATGQADMVGMCRALVADPEWANKARAGRVEEIRRCIGCMKCWVWLVTDAKPLRCAINPTVGRELQPFPLPRRRKKVVVVGGGPGGLEAARASAAAGHAVVLFERAASLGGKLVWAKGHRPYNESSLALPYLIDQIYQLGVDVRLRVAPTKEMVLEEAPDAVVVATGARPCAPDLPSDGSVRIATMGDMEDATVVVMDEDGYFWGATTTEFLARRGCRVTYVTRFFQPLRELAEVTRLSTLRELDKLGVRLLPNAQVERCEGGAVVVRHVYNRGHLERIEGVDALVWVGMQQANDGIAAELEEAGLPNLQVRVIGDAYAPRRLPDAISEGYEAAAALTVAD